MKLISIEPTPSPNSMKLNVDEKLPSQQRYTYTKAQASEAPEPLQSLLAIDGVRSLFRTADFIALDRKPNSDWQSILESARTILNAGSEGQAGTDNESGADRTFGEAHVLVQMYRGIPMQLRIQTSAGEHRTALPEQFTAAVQEAAGASMIRERKLEELGVRYGDPEEIAAEVTAELSATYTPERLRELIDAAAALAGDAASAEQPPAPPRQAPPTPEELAAQLESDDWRIRYAALERVGTAVPEMLPQLARAITDDNTSIRRLAVVYLGDLRSPEALPHLFAALKDRSVSVRRTAGDTLSDLGDPAAIGPMIESLSDSNKLVRWRAARYLYELGDETAIPALREAAKDSEFEIQLQASIALERIERGEEAAGSIWQQMTASRRGQ